MILAYELKDDPGYEHELEVATVEKARALVASYEDMLEWFELTDAEGRDITDLLG